MLQQFGFTQYESQVYSSLITINQALDPTAIVKRSGVPRSKVYEVLHRLSEKGIILETTVEKKRLYIALPLDALIEKLKSDFELNIEELQKINVEEMEADDRVWSLKENHSIQSLMKELSEAAKQTIFISAWADDLNTYLPVLERRYEEGLDVIIHVIGEVETSIPTVSTLIPDQSHSTLERSRIIIVDDQEMMFAGIEDSNWQAIRTQSPPLVKFFTEFFYHDVALTKITQRYKETVMADEEIKEVLMKLRY
ncbi:TrmB family transcriptional regulator [Alkalihalobacillus alcalophilus ATCC 27647 = CGMCC 1.3604]|uniref:TrmB family transcriptional regulator n=1 Tax=Alkalihalobacillus alcalophilus ATCC 27647 = CGMCC 1.3604 TaxID=1218173 RepID=A0A094WQB5_ALKAL|nr:TrmB family transcriptional regulator [Alkalihalobacillus alcalophilus]KGA99006.1 TrmB family transcriptional regulator [Alkalihalobacillus alcalophilus ATCC 27647 = CGMCC 1.3604]MED1560644.1 helix-turn-helix domain-containing protein [Alkalihalobacillus alcalophilus]THG89661.1 TrmB family transcriptional regulator [Alkalihalobacillus alcalophilus ATCC 27647 = CGMCC 1.3604]